MRKIFKKLAFFFVAILSLTVSSSYSVKEVRAEDGTWTLVTDAASLKEGDKLVIASNSKGKVANNTITSSYMTEDKTTFSSDKNTITSLGANAAQLTLGGTSGQWTLTNSSEKKLGATAVKKVAWGSGTTTWSISISSNNATIQSTNSSYGRFLHNVNSTRFTTYTSNTNVSMLLPQIYRFEKSGGSTEPEIPKYSINLEDGPIEIEQGDSKKINFEVSPSNAVINWSSSNASVASVDSDGKINALSIGETKITATLKDDSSVSDEVMVNVIEKPFYSFVFEKQVYTANETKTLGEYDWKLSGDSTPFNSVDSTKGAQFGTKNNPYKEMRLSSVNSFKNVKNIEINTSGASGTNAQLSVQVGDIQIGDSVTLSTSATLFNFSSDKLLCGNIDFKYTQSSMSAIYIKSIKIYCDGILSSSININNSDLKLIEGEDEKLTASVYPSGETIKWSSSNNSVATVDSTGKVKALSIGSAVITASLENDSSIADSINVNVYKNPDCDLNSLTPVYTISNYLPGVDGATNEVHKLDNNTIITTNNCNFNSKLSIYQNDGNIVIESKKVIDKIIVNCYSNSTNISGTLNAYGSLDMESWVDVKSLALHINENASNEEFDLTKYCYNYVKLDISNTPEVVINSITLVLSERVPFVENPISNYETNASLSFNYKYNVIEEAKEPSWDLVTNVNEIEVGDQVVIAAHKYNFALSTTQNGNNRAQAAIEKNNNSITFGDDVQKLTIEKGAKDNTFAFNTGDGYLYAASPEKNYLRTEEKLSDNSSWKIEISSEGVATIKAQGTNTRNWMRYNSSNTPPIFSCYSTGQADICLYKYKAEEKYTDQEFSNVKIGFSSSVNVEDFGGKLISKAGVIFTHTENGEKRVSKTIYSAINTNNEDALYQFLTSNSEDYKYIEKTYTVDNPLKANDNKYSVFGSMSVINGEVNEDNISRLSKTITAAIYFVVDGEVIILQDKTYSVKGMLNEYSTNSALTEQQKEAVNVFKAYIEG